MKVFIQSEAGSFVKHSHDEKTLQLISRSRVSRSYPFLYGFVLDTTGEDGDNVDCFVLTKAPLKTGEIVDCEPFAMMEQMEDDQQDHNILAVLRGENYSFDSDTRQILTEFVRMFLITYLVNPSTWETSSKSKRQSTI
jgi:inorganic pyrophosphatase